ncbi:MAG: glycosyltransferase family 4 protein [Pleurocapsa sp. MO_192.B19]|nr:glycosyltransferase family 4 protein [Pleurocapsa sp. MO_192.B19]
MKFLYIYPYCNLGGVASVLKQRIIHLYRLNHLVELIFQEDGGGKLEWERLGVSVTIYAKNFISCTLNQISEGDYDIVTVIDTPQLIKPLKEVLKTRLFYEIHTSLEHSLSKINPPDLRLCDIIIVPSRWSERKINSMFSGVAEKIKIVPNIIDQTLFYPKQVSQSNQAKTMLWVGKINDLKNWQDALRILSKLLKFEPNIQLKFITGGTISSKLAKQFLSLVSEYNLLDKVEWIHSWLYEEMVDIYNSVAATGGCLLITSDAESFCMIAYEAMRCMLPVVSANHYAMADIFVDERNGMLFAPGNLDEAVNKANKIINNSSLYKSIQKNGWETAEKLDPEKITQEYLKNVSSLGDFQKI